ncbi:hypothetical protein NL676_017395 [Syzygium grande]|nr:hypothetical protein NL676_017395 [Syzygium grande]
MSKAQSPLWRRISLWSRRSLGDLMTTSSDENAGGSPMVQHSQGLVWSSLLLCVGRGREAKGVSALPLSLPPIVTLYCIEDCFLKQSPLVNMASVKHIPLIYPVSSYHSMHSASALLLHSLAALPRTVDSALTAELGLRLVHVDTSRAEEITEEQHEATRMMSSGGGGR